MTLPDDVVAWLQRIHPDPAWAVVKLFDRSQQLGSKGSAGPRQVAELVPLPLGRSLILVQPDVFKQVEGVAVIPLADGRGFLALDPGRGLADLELALLDRIDTPELAEAERAALLEVRERIKGWRQLGVRFEARSILVAERVAGANPRARQPPLSELATV